MPTSLSIDPNPNVLVWARQESGYPIERVAKSVGVKPERIESWESGERNPTMKQLQKLAKFLHRPVGLFFLPKPPPLKPLATEYRRLPGVESGEESPELRLAIRQMSNRRDTMLNLLIELGESAPSFDLEAHLNETPETVAHRLREALNIDPLTQQQWRGAWRAWASWRSAVENLGVLVFQFPSVELEEARGLSLLLQPMPVAAVNPKETSPEARSFTLIHEVVHLMLAEGKEERPAARESKKGEEWAVVERFAETVASHTLVPEESLKLAVDNLELPKTEWDIADVRKLARLFSITPLAMATRLRASGFMKWEAYHSWKRMWDSYTATLKPRKGGFAHPVDLTLGRAGRPFTKTVLEALNTNRIGPEIAARYLNLKFQHFEKLKGSLTLQPGSGGVNE